MKITQLWKNMDVKIYGSEKTNMLHLTLFCEKPSRNKPAQPPAAEEI